MFREMIRKKQQISDAECVEVLKSQPRGVLSVLGDDGYPYGFPVDFFYDEESGKLYFHGSKKGHKIDAIKNCDKVSFCVYDEGYRKEGEWALNIKSVIIFGRIKELEDMEMKTEMCRRLALKFTSDTEYIEKEIATYSKGVNILELTPEHMTGKLVNES